DDVRCSIKDFFALKGDIRVHELRILTQCDELGLDSVASTNEIFDFLNALLSRSPVIEKLNIGCLQKADESVALAILLLLKHHFCLDTISLPYFTGSFNFIQDQMENGWLQSLTLCGEGWPR
uniref:F-box/LRR-repeat protein n=1 Tax=Steinernema glaseri TaxID=37863 RepID=A0A1I8AV00_9BILA